MYMPVKVGAGTNAGISSVPPTGGVVKCEYLKLSI